MSIQAALEHRRAIRQYDETRPLDSECIKHCLELATLAPTSSNMQLWEAYHVTGPTLLRRLGRAGFGQTALTSAPELVVFVVRPDYARRRAKANLAAQREAIRKAYPEEKWEKYTKRQDTNYGKLVPFLYARCFGLVGLLRKALVQLVGLFTPVPRQVSEADYDVVLHKSCALVAQSFMLAMSEQGYDTCPLEGFDSWRVKRALHLPYAAQVSMIVSCGVRRADVPLGERSRIPFEEQYHRLG